MFSPEPPPAGAYLALCTYTLTREENEQLISHLRLPKSLAQTLRDTSSIKDKLHLFANPELAPSSIYSLLHGYSLLSLRVSTLASDSPVVQQHINLFINKLRYVKPALTGNDLIKMGFPPGPRIKEILHQLHIARLDGKITSKRDEEEMVKHWNQAC